MWPVPVRGTGPGSPGGRLVSSGACRASTSMGWGGRGHRGPGPERESRPRPRLQQGWGLRGHPQPSRQPQPTSPRPRARQGPPRGCNAQAATASQRSVSWPQGWQRPLGDQGGRGATRRTGSVAPRSPRSPPAAGRRPSRRVGQPQRRARPRRSKPGSIARQSGGRSGGQAPGRERAAKRPGAGWQREDPANGE